MGILDWLRVTYYLRISADRVWFRNVERGREWSEAAVMAIETIGTKKTVAAVGDVALGLTARAGIELHYPFAHPRVPIGDFTLAEMLLTHLVRRFVGLGGTIRPMVRVVVHPVREVEGGLSQIELRAFEEIVAAVGARRIRVIEGHVRADAEIDALFSGN